MKKSKLSVWIVVMLVFVVMLSGCKPSDVAKTNGNDGGVELVWYYIGDTYKESEEIYQAANEIIKKEIGATVKFSPISMGEYTNKMQLKSSAAESFDLCFTSGWNFDYYDNTKKGAFLPLDELLAKKGQKTKALINEKIWAATKIDDKIYAVPNYQVSYKQQALVFKKDLVEKYQLQEQIDKIENFKDMTPIFQIIKDNEPNIIPTIVSAQLGWYEVGGNYYEKISSSYVGVDQNLNVVDLSAGKMGEIEKEAYRVSREWNKKNFYHPDAGVTTDLGAELKAGKFFVIPDSYIPGIEQILERRNGYPVYVKRLGEPVLTNDSACAALTAISRTSKNPEKAMEFLELINNNKALYNLISFGIQDKHYKMVGDDSIKILDGVEYNTNQWALGNQFNSYKLEGQSPTIWEDSIKENDEAKASPLLGFRLNVDNIRTELANITTALAPYGMVLGYGLNDNWETLLQQRNTEMQQDNKKVYEEVVRQIEEFKKQKANN